ncbi:MAG: SLC13 family permease, partial [Neofamilia sp.]
LIPIQISGVVLTIGLAIILGNMAKKNAKLVSTADLNVEKESNQEKPKFLLLNTLLTVGVIGVLVLDIIPSYLTFMIGLCLVLVINYPTLKLQDDKIKEHAASALIISATMLAAGVMVGIMNGTGILEAMAKSILAVIPDFMGRYIHLIFGFTALPMGMMIGTDAYFYGIMPLVIEVGEQFGVAALNTATTMLIGKNISLMISPLVPATFLSIGLVNVELKDHIKFAFKWLYATSIIMIVFAIVIGLVTL